MASPNRIISGAGLTYSLLSLLWLGLRWLLADRLWPLAIINTAIFYFFLPLPVLLLAAVWQRRRRAILALLVPLGALVFFWGALFPPSFSPAGAEPAKELKTMTHNVLFSNETPGVLAAGVLAAAPDIVGFQELTPRLMASLEADLLAAYPHHTFDLFGSQGVGLMSRHPILSARTFAFPPRDDRALHVVVDWAGVPVDVFVVHLSANNFFDNPLAQLPDLARERYGQRAEQASRIAAELGRVDGPVVLMCDCNFTDTSEAYAQLRALLDDSHRAAGWGLGHTLQPPGLPFPVQRIDFVWYGGGLTAVAAAVARASGSDHRPVIATLRYNGRE